MNLLSSWKVEIEQIWKPEHFKIRNIFKAGVLPDAFEYNDNS